MNTSANLRALEILTQGVEFMEALLHTNPPTSKEIELVIDKYKEAIAELESIQDKHKGLEAYCEKQTKKRQTTNTDKNYKVGLHEGEYVAYQDILEKLRSE